MTAPDHVPQIRKTPCAKGGIHTSTTRAGSLWFGGSGGWRFRDVGREGDADGAEDGVGSNTVIDDRGGGRIVLAGLALDQIDGVDFLF